jgi:hypothetical protein
MNESGLEPENDRGHNEHGAIIDRAFVVARGEPAPLFEATG